MNVRDATLDDAEAVAAIYNHYVVNTVITFEQAVVSTEEMAGRVAAVTERYPWLVAETDDGVVGYAYATAWHARAAYRHTVEASVYLCHKSTGRGYGSVLYQELMERLSALDVHAVIGGAALPNDASVALHEKFGFEKVAHYREVGRKFGRWIDVAYWQQVLTPGADPEGASSA